MAWLVPDRSLFTPGLHAALKLADPAEGPSKNGFAPVVKGVLPDVVNISTSKVVKASDQNSFDDQDGIPPFFQQFFGQQFPGMNQFGTGFRKVPRQRSARRQPGIRRDREP